MEASNIERYKSDLDKLISDGDRLQNAAYFEFMRERFVDVLRKDLKNEKEVKRFIKNIPSFNLQYQTWYSEALSVLKQLLPDRVGDFVGLYKKPVTRKKDITYENYVIEDALQSLRVTRGWEKEVVVDESAAIPKFQQQLSIIKSIKKRFESSLFDIRQLVQADIFDSEIETARELNGKGFVRAAGAIAGVVLEGHLLQVCGNHNIKVTKKNPGINDLASELKDSDVINTPEWRKIQYLADLRNVCDHKKKIDPTKAQIDDLIDGVSRFVKTIF